MYKSFIESNPKDAAPMLDPSQLTLNTTEQQFIYRTRAIISRGLYIFYPIFKDHFFVFKEVF